MRTYQATGGRWGIDYTEPSGRRVRRIVGTKAAATAALSRVQVAILDGTYGRLATRRRVTVEQVAELWRTERGHKAGWPAVRGHLARAVDHFGPQLDVLRLGRSEVAAWRRVLADEGLSPSTRNRHVASLRAALSLAMDHDLIIANPLRRTKMEVEPPPPDRVATQAEVAQLLKTGTARDALVVVWALESGARCGEMAAARWSDLRLTAGEWRIPRSKSGHPRTVPLTPRAIDALTRWQADPVTVTHRDRKPVRIHGHPVVLGGVTPSGLSSAFAAHCRRAGVAGLRLHDLRHTCATEMRRRGVHSVTIAAMLGHRSWQMVQRYQHVTQDDLRLAINAG